MSIITKRALGGATDHEYWVIVIIPTDTLPRLRESLAATNLRSTTVSNAVSWSGGGSEYAYRGQRYRCDRNVVRVEIVCNERHVDAVVAAVAQVIGDDGSSGRTEGSVVAFPVTHTAEASAIHKD